MLALRDGLRQVPDTQLQHTLEEEIVRARRMLGDRYGDFIRRYGPVPSSENIRAIAGDPNLPLLLCLENYNPETKRATKIAIFERRTLERYKPVEHGETAAEKLAVSLNETGDINWLRTTELTGLSLGQRQRELGSLVYRNPEEGLWEPADRYLELIRK